MAITHLAYPDLPIDKFSGTDPDQDAEPFIQLIERKTNLLLKMHLQMLVSWPITLSGRKRCFLLHSEDQPLSGMRTILPSQQSRRMFEQISSLDFQIDETNSDTAWKLTNVLEEMEKKFETPNTVSNERLIKAVPMIWTVLGPLTITLNVRPKEDNDTTNTH